MTATIDTGTKISYDAQGRKTLTHPEAATITKEVLVERARAMIPALRERAARSEEARQLLPETFEEFVAAGFFRTCQPKRFGGFELDLQALQEILIEVARGDGSAAWNLGILTGHAWWASMFPEEGQIEIFGDDGHALLPTGIFGRGGTGRKVDGGYVISGKWMYQSGVDSANWLGVGAVIDPSTSSGQAPSTSSGQADKEEAPYGVTFIVPREQGTIVDDWHVMGMRGTGSKSVTMQDVFVPESRSVLLQDLDDQTLPGSKLHTNPFYSTPLMAFISIEITGAAVGVAFHAVDILDEIARGKPSRRAPGGAPMYEMEQPHIRRRLGEAKSYAQAARVLLLSEAEKLGAMMRDYAPRGQKLTREEIANVTLHQARVIDLSVKAVDHTFAAAGTSATQQGHAMERCFRDVHMISTHTVYRFDNAAEAWARVHFGIDNVGVLPGGVAEYPAAKK